MPILTEGYELNAWDDAKQIAALKKQNQELAKQLEEANEYASETHARFDWQDDRITELEIALSKAQIRLNYLMDAFAVSISDIDAAIKEKGGKP